MSTPLEEYALLSDLRTAPLVSRSGSIDWLCLPRFDSPAVFSALLGEPDDGRWLLSAVDGEVTERRYLPNTFVLETTWTTPDGVARVTDFLPTGATHGDLVRRVECLSGRVEIEHDLRLRFDYARSLPWTREVDHAGATAWLALAGPDAVCVTGPALSWPEDLEDDAPEEPGNGLRAGRQAPRLAGRFAMSEGDCLDWDLTWFPSHEDPPEPPETGAALAETIAFWSEWATPLEAGPHHRPEVLHSLMVLRALTHADTGGIVAAPTASLPEHFGGERNWDYRYTWLRDAALTIEVAIAHGLTDGARLWRDWLLRAVAGDVDDVRIMYGVAGERDLVELELDHLVGYEGSRPVRIGNGAAEQYQADVVGEVMIALHELRAAGVEDDEYTWGLQKGLLAYQEKHLDREDHGIWEMRGDLHKFTHGRVMMWAAFDRGIRAVTEHGLDGPVERWRELRAQIAAEIEEHGFDAELDSYTQTYDNAEADASLLQLPHTGYLAYDDPRMLGTVAHIEKDLVLDGGLVHRYRTDAGMDGLEGEEYPFLLCSFWLVEQYAATGRVQEAQEIMDHVVGRASDVGLLAEQYDPVTGRMAGNFPQAFSHLGLIRAADAICRATAEDDC